jgi:hypothetical protein
LAPVLVARRPRLISQPSAATSWCARTPSCSPTTPPMPMSSLWPESTSSRAPPSVNRDQGPSIAI